MHTEKPKTDSTYFLLVYICMVLTQNIRGSSQTTQVKMLTRDVGTLTTELHQPLSHLENKFHVHFSGSLWVWIIQKF